MWQLSPHAASLGLTRPPLPVLVRRRLVAIAQSVRGLVDVRQVLPEEIQQLAAGRGGAVEGRGGEEDRMARGFKKRGERGTVEDVSGGFVFAAVVGPRFRVLWWDEVMLLLSGAQSSLLHAAQRLTGLEPVQSAEGRGDRGGV